MLSIRLEQETVLSVASRQPSQNRTLFPTQLTSQTRPPPLASRGEEQHPLFRWSPRLRVVVLGDRVFTFDFHRFSPTVIKSKGLTLFEPIFIAGARYRLCGHLLCGPFRKCLKTIGKASATSDSPPWQC